MGQIGYETSHGIARLTLDQPEKLNAMSYDMWLSLAACIKRAEADEQIRVITLTGAGTKAFCAGADISQFQDKRNDPASVQAYEDAVTKAFTALLTANKPIIALIRGICFGGGLALALCCDIRVSDGAARMRIPAARLGLGYAYANIATMVHKIGVNAATDLLLSARIVDAREGQRLGLVNLIFDEDFTPQAEAYVREIATNAPLTMRAIKTALHELSKPETQRDIATANALVQACFDSADYQEGQAAFAAKRQPEFQGR